VTGWIASRFIVIDLDHPSRTLHNATDFPTSLHFLLSLPRLHQHSSPPLLSLVPTRLYIKPLRDTIAMRTGYLLSLLPLLAPLGISAARGRSSDYTPSPPADNEEVAEVTIRSFDLSERERQAVFGDTSKLSQSWEVYKLNLNSHNKTTESHRLPCLDSQTARRTV